MAIVEASIKSDLVALTDILKEEEDQAEAIDKWATELAKIIVEAIKSADVVAGIPVATAGSATAQTGATTGTGTLI